MCAPCVVFFLAAALAAACCAEAALVEHTFVVSQMKMHHMCNDSLVTLVNGQFPGPAIEVTEGDSVVVHVINKSPRGVTIHWHGVKQQNNCWADGPGMITQCPIQPNKNFTYRFNVIGQEGTLWWHAHIGFLRATIHGALIIRPRSGPNSYPFPKPDKEIPIVIGEWFDMDVFELYEKTENRIYGDIPRSHTINGMLGDFNNCSGVIEDSYLLDVGQGKTYLLRIVNAAVDKVYNLKIAGHKFTVVGADANYVKPYTTNIIVIASGETFDALVVADAPPGRYYMVAQAVQTTEPITQKRVLMSRGIVSYNPMNWSGDDTLIMAPELPDWHDERPSFYFHGNLTSLLPQPVPSNIDEHMFIALKSGDNCLYVGSPHCKVTMINNISFQLPSMMSLLQAHYYNNMSNISTLQEIPRAPPRGLGYYDAEKDVHKYNLVNPSVRNTAHVPMYGWTVIRFVASNPGVWFFHCHTEHHSSSGMAMAFVVEDGPTVETTLPPPPADYPSCDGQNSIVEYV
ncbi:hypothetical protein ACQ4PT_055689 [Festuca glaucescens]